MSNSCRCVTCAECRGLGKISVPQRGYPEWDLETCPGCDGNGIVEECQHCRDEAERLDDECLNVKTWGLP